MTLFPNEIRPFPDCDEDEPFVGGLSLQQPYATCVVDGPKRIENRPWEPPARLRGRAFWFAVHASATLYEGAELDDFTGTSLFRRDAQGKFLPPLWPDCPQFAAMPARAILGAARVIGWERLRDGDDRLGPWAFGPVCWKLDPTVIRLPQPFPWPRGALGLWKLDDARMKSDPARGAELLVALREAKQNPACHRRVDA